MAKIKFIKKHGPLHKNLKSDVRRIAFVWDCFTATIVKETWVKDPRVLENLCTCFCLAQKQVSVVLHGFPLRTVPPGTPTGSSLHYSVIWKWIILHRRTLYINILWSMSKMFCSQVVCFQIEFSWRGEGRGEKNKALLDVTDAVNAGFSAISVILAIIKRVYTANAIKG